MYKWKNIFQNLFFRVSIVYHIGGRIPEDQALSGSLLRYLDSKKNAQFFFATPCISNFLSKCV